MPIVPSEVTEAEHSMQTVFGARNRRAITPNEPHPQEGSGFSTRLTPKDGPEDGIRSSPVLNITQVEY